MHFRMVNLYEILKSFPPFTRQLSCKGMLFTNYDCPQTIAKVQFLVECNFIAYVISGRRIFHKNNKSWELKEGSCAFVNKGTHVAEREHDDSWCVMVFFMPDLFLKNLLEENKSTIPSVHVSETVSDHVLMLEVNELSHSFFVSMLPYFSQSPPPPESLLELKFKELVLSLLANPANHHFLSRLGQIAHEGAPIIEQVMFENYMYNLSLSDYANHYYQSALYKFPAIGASVGSLIAPIALAVARNAIEELKLIATKKVSFGAKLALRKRNTIQRKLGMAEAMVQSARAYLNQELETCWNKTLKGDPVSIEEKASMMLAVTQVNQSCWQAVDLMYAAAGTTGIYTSNKLSRLFVDAQVIRQHGFPNESRYETAAQLYLGLEPDLPVVLF